MKGFALSLSLSGVSLATPDDLEVRPALRDLHVIEAVLLVLQLPGPFGRRKHCRNYEFPNLEFPNSISKFQIVEIHIYKFPKFQIYKFQVFIF